MFKKVASDVLGLSDIGQVVSPKDYDKVASDDYVLHEDGEKIYFLIKSQTDEYCFTNYALIHLDGHSATSQKRLLKRYSYKNNPVSDVKLETAGTVDLDIEIKFNLGNNSYSIDVRRQDIEYLKDLYKSLVKIASIQKENARYLEFAEKSINIASSVLKPYHQESTEKQFKAINVYTFNWLKKSHQTFNKKDFSDVFSMFINN